MNDPPLVRVHGLQFELLFETDRLFRQLVGKILQREFAVFAVIFAIDHNSFVFVAARIGHGSRDRLNGVQHRAALADHRVGIGRGNIDFYLFLFPAKLRAGRNFENVKQPFQKLDGSFSVGAAFRVAVDRRLPFFGFLFLFRLGRRFGFFVSAFGGDFHARFYVSE